MGHRLARTASAQEPDEQLLIDIAKLVTPGVLGRKRAVAAAVDDLFLDRRYLAVQRTAGPDLSRRGAFEQRAPLFAIPTDDPHLQLFAEHGELRAALQTAVTQLRELLPADSEDALLHDLRAALTRCLAACIPEEVPDEGPESWEIVARVHERLRKANVLNATMAASTAVLIGELFGFEVRSDEAPDPDEARAERFLRRRRRQRRAPARNSASSNKA